MGVEYICPWYLSVVVPSNPVEINGISRLPVDNGSSRWGRQLS